MPTYQYRCEKCGHVFEHVEHVEAHAAHLREAADVRCPKCGSAALAHQPTRFFARTSKKS